MGLHLRVDYKCSYEKIKEKNNINNNKYVWEVEFRGGKSREKYRSKSMGPMGPWVISMGPQIQGPIARSICPTSSLHFLSNCFARVGCTCFLSDTLRLGKELLVIVKGVRTRGEYCVN
jgi:hypothetical protein